MKHLKKRKLVTLIAVAATLMFAWFNFDGKPVSSSAYRTEVITRGSITELVTANGTINPVELLTIGAQVSGKVERVYVNVNDRVKKGQLLAEVDPSILQTQLRQDKASLETARSSFQQAERDLSRTRTLVEKDYIAKVELERAEQAYLQSKNSYESSKTVVERAQVNLDYTKITSPIDGVIISQEVTMGQTLASNFQSPNLFKIAGDLAQMKIDVSLSESDIIKVKKGMKVTFTVTAYPDQEFQGMVDTVNLSPNTQQGVVMYNVSVLAENPGLLLLPGMTAYVSMVVSEKKDVLRVSASALRFKPPMQKRGLMEQLFMGKMAPSPVFSTDDPNSRTIYLLKGAEPAPVEVITGATDDTFVEITGKDVKEGDQVVTGLQIVSMP